MWRSDAADLCDGPFVRHPPAYGLTIGLAPAVTVQNRLRLSDSVSRVRAWLVCALDRCEPMRPRVSRLRTSASFLLAPVCGTGSRMAQRMRIAILVSGILRAPVARSRADWFVGSLRTNLCDPGSPGVSSPHTSAFLVLAPVCGMFPGIHTIFL